MIFGSGHMQILHIWVQDFTILVYLFRAEINISPWHLLLKNMKEGNERIKWMDREPYAYWKGNPSVAATRRDLLTCNVSEKQDWNARLYVQVCVLETRVLMLGLHFLYFHQ